VTVAVTDGGDRRRALAVRDLVAGALSSGSPLLAQTDLKGVALVGAGPGDPELITVKGRRLLAAADVVVADHLAPGLLLGELRPEVEFVDAAKIPYGPQKAQEEINRILIERAQEGKFVVRLKGGDPFVFGRGGEEMIACAEAGVPVLVVPGVTSPIAAPGLAGIPVTHRGVAHEFTVVSGHVSPDNPASLVDWAALARLRGTLVVLMGMKNLPTIAERLIAEGRPASTPAAVIQEGSTDQQRSLRSTLGSVAADTAAAGLRSPAIVVIGEVVDAVPA
jgi:uroporphyrin-III C-methyltransferase/precorrin-2 dehydrogenase/sirohydrochlorin ferrochelatase